MKRKCFVASNLLVRSVAVLALGLALQTFAQNETLAPSTVVRLKGHARCSTDGGKTWKMVKVGDRLDSGSMIQTAQKSDLDVVLGEQASPPVDGAFYNPETHPANLVSLSEDTLVRIDKTARKQIAGSPEPVEEILLDLRKGTITGNVRKPAGASRYEIAFVNGVAGMREGIYKLRASGELSVLKGKALIALADGKAAQEVAAGQQFDPGTGLIAELPPESPQVFAQPADSHSERPATISPVRRVPPANTGLRRAGP